MRVFELAKKIGVSSKELMAEMEKIGLAAKSHMSSLYQADIQIIMERMGKKEAPHRTSSLESRPKVLIKRRQKPEETPPVAVPPEEQQPVKISVEPPQAESGVAGSGGEGVPAPLSTAPVSHESRQEVEGIGKAVPTVAEAPSVLSGPLLTRETVLEGEEPGETGKPVDVVPVEAVPKEKRELPKVKKGKKQIKWGKEEFLFEFQETGEWQDFKPLHKRTERLKTPKKSHPSSLIEITKPRKKSIKIFEGLTVREFAELIGQKSTTVIAKLMEMGIMAMVNHPMDLDAALLIADNFGVKVEIVPDQTEEELLNLPKGDPSFLRPRPPVVTIMGHVDHGKTSLLDAIREARVAEGEAGGITQRIGAYTVKVRDRQVTFLDTPGHEAFTAMRARGAKVTDIVVLVVAADDGVMPQTVEAINHARAAHVPIVVAINKIDKPQANPEKVRQSMAEYGLIPEAWGGQTIFVEVSAKKRIGLDTLLEMILLQAEMLELKADPHRPASGTVIEAKLDKGRGPIATVLVRDGILRVGDTFVTGVHCGRIRALVNDCGQKVEEALPSTPVEVIGLDGVPQAGESFIVVEDERIAKDIATSRLQRQRAVEFSRARRTMTLEDLHKKIQEGVVKELNIIIKAEGQGSVEALTESFTKLSTPAVRLRILHGGVGGITETDVLLASASDAIIIGFNVRPESSVEDLAAREKVDIRFYTVIYDAISDLKAAMEGLLEPTFRERVAGRAEVRQTFNIPKVGVIAGAYVIEGVVSRGASGARVIRDSVQVYEGKIGSLRRFKDDVKEVQAGYECGIGIENFNDIKVGDIIEVFTVEKIETKL